MNTPSDPDAPLWCQRCGRYHRRPRTPRQHRDAKCRAEFRPPNVEEDAVKRNIQRLRRAGRDFRFFVAMGIGLGWREVGVIQWFTMRRFVKSEILLGRHVDDGPVSAKVAR